MPCSSSRCLVGLGQAADTRVELDSTALVGLFDLRYSHLFRLKESPCVEEARGIRRQKAQPLCAWHCSDTPCPSPSPCNLRWGDLRRMSQTGVSLDQEAWSVESRAKAGDTAEVQEVFESAVHWQGSPQGVLLLPFKCPFPPCLPVQKCCLPGAGVAGRGPGGTGWRPVLRRVLFNSLFAAVSGKAVLMFSLPLLVPFPSPHQKVPPFPTAQSPPPPLSFLQVVR